MTIRLQSGAILIAAINNNSIEAAGVRVKDVITKINGIEIKNMSTIYSEIRNRSPGDKITITLFRPPINGQQTTTFDANITLVEEMIDTKDNSPQRRH